MLKKSFIKEGDIVIIRNVFLWIWYDICASADRVKVKEGTELKLHHEHVP